MKMSLYIQSHGTLSRRDNTILFINEEVGKKVVPIAQVRDIHCFGKVSISSGVVDILSAKNIPLHFYNKYGMHISSLMPRTELISGKVLVAQVKGHLDKNIRLNIASSIVDATRRNMLTVLSRYLDKDQAIVSVSEELKQSTVPTSDIAQILAAEAGIWKTYYRAFTPISPKLPFEKRSFRPPENEMNALISLLNTLLYTSTLSMITQTYLNPTISFLHEPHERRFSLSLDIAEYFKPLIVHRLIFRLVNRGQITAKSFTKKDGIKLTPRKFTLVLNEFNGALNSLIGTRKKKKVSYRTQLKYECHKLVKYLIGDKKFKPYLEG